MRLGTTLLLAVVVAGLARGAAADGGGVLAYHNGPGRSGLFTAPGLDWARARRVHLDARFNATFSGNLYAQPLYWMPPGATSGELIVATENDTVAALDATTGGTRWQKTLGTPVPNAQLPCGNIDPLGITGTPVIDPAKAEVYLDAVVGLADGVHHQIFALRLSDGATLPGWPVDVGAAVSGFPALYQNQRGGLTILDRRLYVPYGGHAGDCGPYHGWVVGVALDNPADVIAWQTRAQGGGIWAPGEISSDGQSLYVATGNTFNAATWQDGEAVIRLPPDLAHRDRRQDYFTPSDWRRLDATDRDLGGANPMLLDVPAASGTTPFVLQLGKDGFAYLLDRNDLGGRGGELLKTRAAPGAIITAPAAYPLAGGVAVVFRGPNANHANPAVRGVTALEVQAGPPTQVTIAWHAGLDGAGSAIVTTTDGSANPIVWITGAEGDNRLHGFRGDTGAVLFDGGGAAEQMTGLRHFGTLLAAGNRLYVGADGRIYAFAY